MLHSPALTEPADQRP